MKAEERFDWIESYLQNEMSAGEKAAFEQQLQVDAQLKDELHWHQQANGLIVDQALLDFKKEMKQFAENYAKPKKNLRTRNIILSTTAVVVGTTIGLIVLLNNREKDQISDNREEIEQIENTDIQEQKNTTSVNNKQDKKSASITDVNEAVHQNSVIDENTTEEAEVSAEAADTSAASLNVTDENSADEQQQIEQEQTAETNVLPDDNEQVEEDVNHIDCDKVDFEATIKTKNTCIEEVNGEIQIRSSSVTGGTPPYEYAINNEGFINSGSFRYLEAGLYQILIRDANNCEKPISTVRIETDFCKKEFVFAPDMGETWEIPMYDFEGGTIKILNKAGRQVYFAELSSFSNNEWAGTTTENEQLPMGLYKFIINYTEGKTFVGFVTIVK